MKNFLILGLLALLLFSVSAALSMWLNQSKQQAENKEKEKDEKVAKGKDKDAPPKEKDAPEAPKPAAKAPDVPAGGSENTARDLRDQQDKLLRRAGQIEVVVRDLQTQREATEATLRQVMSQLKTVSTDTAKLDALAIELKEKMAGFEVGEKKNIDKIAEMYNAMSPEAAGPILKQMADTGRMDLAAKILTQMKETKAARVLEAMNDPALALAIVEKMRTLRPAPAAPGPGNGAVVPAKGP